MNRKIRITGLHLSMQKIGTLIATIFFALLISACVTTGSKGAPGQDQYYITRDEYKGIRLFQEVPITLNYTVLGYLRINSRDAYLSEALLERLYTEATGRKGNALIEINRDLKINTSGYKRPTQGTRSIFDDLEGAVINDYYEWTATIVLLMD